MGIQSVLLIVGVLVSSGASQHNSFKFRQGTTKQQNASVKMKQKKGSTMQLSSYLLFDGNCKQAMQFYHTVFDGELTLATVGESPMKAIFPASMHHKVINARLKSKVVELFASDWLRPDQTPVQGNTRCLYLSGGTSEETAAIFLKLSAGAEVTDPLSEQPFGCYGALNDQFGVRWMFHAEGQ